MGDMQQDLELFINECKKNNTRVHLIGILNVLKYIDVYVPLVKTHPMIPYMLKDPGHDYLMSVFTKKEYIPEKWQSSSMMKMPFSKAVEFMESNIKVDTTIVIDPYHQNFILEKEAIQLFKNIK